MKSLSYLNKYLIKYKWLLLLGVLFLLGSNIFYVKMPSIVRDTVNELENDFSPENWILQTAKMAGLYILFSLGKGVFLFFQRQTIIKVSRHIEYDLKNEIYNQYQSLNYTFYKKNSTGDLMNRISEDVAKVRMYLGPGIMYTINLVILFVLILYMMLDINVELTLLTLVPLPIMSVLVYMVSSRMNRESEQVQREQSLMSTVVQEAFSGIRVLKVYNGEERFQDKFNNSAQKYLSKQMRLVKTNALFMPTITFLIGVSTVITIYYGGILSYEAKNSISTGNIAEFMIYINMLTWPFASVGWVTSLVQRAAASQERINEFLNEKPHVKNETEQPFEFKGKITFNNVTYTYPTSGIEAIKNLSFEVKKGETLAIIGRTGSGKSSILNLLLRQFDPISGEILIDDQPIKKINLEAFRQQTGVVPQEVFLFSDTIKNNVNFGLATNDQLSDEAVIKILKTTHVYHNIQEFKSGIHTVLGERGVNLSGGQKQRISIARALIRKPKLLILDDCLSAVDTETEEVILTNLKEQIENNTTIIVSHRVSSIRNADRILVLTEGEKVEEGTHSELLAGNGVYAEMYNQQLLEEKDNK